MPWEAKKQAMSNHLKKCEIDGQGGRRICNRLRSDFNTKGGTVSRCHLPTGDPLFRTDHHGHPKAGDT